MKNSLSKIEFWLFDLDNTIYHPNTKIFNQIDLRMKKYISKILDVSEDEAFKVQKEYYRKYGTTLFGLMKNNKVNADDFLNYVHNINLENLEKSNELINLLESLPGKKYIYTNGDSRHAENVLKKLEINDLFDGVFDIKKSGLIPKPEKKSLLNLLDFYRIDPRKTIYFEDLEKNLMAASIMGITTVLIDYNKNSLKNSYVDYSFNTLIEALKVIKSNLEKGIK